MNTTHGQKLSGPLEPSAAWNVCASFAAETGLSIYAVVTSEISAWLFNYMHQGLESAVNAMNLTPQDVISLIEYGQIQAFYPYLDELWKLTLQPWL